MISFNVFDNPTIIITNLQMKKLGAEGLSDLQSTNTGLSDAEVYAFSASYCFQRSLDLSRLTE